MAVVSIRRRRKAPVMSDERFDLERMLMDADRMMMQVVTTSLSLIGFGFTLFAFFNSISNGGVVARADVNARRIGFALLSLGLLLLALAIWGQVGYRAQLARRFAVRGVPIWRECLTDCATPSFITALLLLVVGLGALTAVLLRRFG